MAKKTLIIIPAFNEEASLPGVLAGLRLNAPEHDVLVVDDGSTDRTAEVAATHGATVATLPFNLGVGGAVRTGFQFAVRQGYDRAIQFDADGQHDPLEIPGLLGELDAGADLVIGSRFADGSHEYNPGRVRGRAMGLLRLTLNLLAGQRFTDTSSGFRAYSRRLLEFFARTYPVEYLSDTVEALLLACYAGFTVVERPVVMHRRAGGAPSNRNVKLIYHYLRLLLVLASTASLRGRAARRGAAA